MTMRYKSAAALEMAIKAAAVASPIDTDRAMSAFYFHRLLCRVFADGNRSFVLKGGQAMLARTVDARATRDVDLLSSGASVDAAVDELVRLSEIDLGDFVTFEFAGSRPIMADDEYRDGASVEFVPMLGAKRMQPFSVDLVVDDVPLDDVECISPADRLEVEGLAVCDYPVYPIENTLADKFCGIVETHNGRPSSRVKDLVDIAVCAVTSEVDGGRLQRGLRREAAVRRISLGDGFKTPDAWGAPQARQFSKLCQRTGLPESLRDISAAAKLAGSLLDPAIRGEVEGLAWSPAKLEWSKRRESK
jgi:hypothetical protein